MYESVTGLNFDIEGTDSYRAVCAIARYMDPDMEDPMLQTYSLKHEQGHGLYTELYPDLSDYATVRVVDDHLIVDTNFNMPIEDAQSFVRQVRKAAE